MTATAVAQLILFVAGNAISFYGGWQVTNIKIGASMVWPTRNQIIHNWAIQATAKYIVKLCAKLMHKSYNVQIKATCSSETSEFQRIKWHYLPENRALHILYNTSIALQLSQWIHCFCKFKKWRIRSEFDSRQWALHNDAETISESAASNFNNFNIIKEEATETWSQIQCRVEK